MATVTLQQPEASASCRTDYASFSFRNTATREVDELMAWLEDLSRFLLPQGQWDGPTSGRHFTDVFNHSSGLAIEFTPPHIAERNSGISVIRLPGQIWGALDSDNRLELITDIDCLPGYCRCTRWDAQLTLLEPPLLVPDFVDAVEAGRIWPVRYGVGNSWTRRNLHGEHIESPTQYFGGKASMCLARVYDHGAKWGWEVPTIRLEVQMRRTWADDHFRRLRDRANKAMRHEHEPNDVEETTVKEALAQHLDLRDTSQWAGKRKPKNWAQAAPKLDWYEKALEGKHDPLKPTYRPSSDLWKTREAGCAQYGPKQLITVLSDAYRLGCGLEDAGMALLGEMALHVKDHHFEMLQDVIAPEHLADARKTLEVMRRFGAEWTEHVVREK